MALAGHVDEISRSAVEGWVVDTDRPDQIVSVSILVNGVHRGMCLATHPRTDVLLPDGASLTGKVGFWFAFDPPLSPFIEQRIDVMETWSAQLLLNGSRVLPRPKPDGAAAAGRVPILLTSTGRTGTTLLMSEFARHPDIVVGDHFPYEIKQIAYYSAAFRALAADADRERSTTPETMLAPEMHRIVGSNPYNMSGLFGLGGAAGALSAFYQSTVPSGLAAVFRRFIAEFYATLAHAQDKRHARYFCEKSDIDDAAVQGARLFFDTVRDIVIVRDPRDLLCSAIAFWKLRPELAMNMLATTVPRLARLTRRAGPDRIVIRYEDLVRDPRGTRQVLSRFLDLDLLKRPSAEFEPIPESHRTSRDPAASIGRWRDDLTRDQVEACEVAFGPYMRDFDYEPSLAPGGRTRSRANRRETPGNRIVAAEGPLAVAAFIENTLAESEDTQAPRQVLELKFGQEGTGEAFTGDGWSVPERGFVWSNAPECDVKLPPIRRDGEYRMFLTLSPFTHGMELPSQRVSVLFDGQAAGRALVRDICVLSLALPAALSHSRKPIALTLRFPDAASPSTILGSADTRLLGFALHRIALFRTETALGAAEPAGSRPAGRSSAVGEIARENRAAGPSGGRARSDTHDAGADDLAARITELSRAAFNRAELKYHAGTVLRQIPGYDSIRFVRLIMALEEASGISLHEEAIDSIETMGDLAALFRDKMPQP